MAGPGVVAESVTAIEKAGSALLSAPSVTEIWMSLNVPVDPVGGTPAISPVAALKVAQFGSRLT